MQRMLRREEGGQTRQEARLRLAAARCVCAAVARWGGWARQQKRDRCFGFATEFQADAVVVKLRE
jgi:hypothetical protein